MKKLEEIPIAYNWSGQGAVREELFPAGFDLIEPPRVKGQRNVRKRIRFGKPLDKGDVAEYSLLLRCTQTGRAPEPFLGISTSHRVDELVMRVVFPANLCPNQVFYIKRNADGVEVHKETIAERDDLTGEFRKVIRYAEPHISHVLEWTPVQQPEERL
jgi:hypothetical protein